MAYPQGQNVHEPEIIIY